MANNKEVANAHFGALAGKLVRVKLILSDEADEAMKEYEKFLGEECIQFKDKFEAFNQDKDRLDEFLGVFLRGKKQYKSLWKVCVIVFVLSHGQSDVERDTVLTKKCL